MERAALTRWIEEYERAWRTEGTEALTSLFTEDATYRTAPFEQPFRGLTAIAEMWEEGREGPDEVFSLDTDVIAVDGDTGVIRVEVSYGDPVGQTYRDIWIVELRDGLCRAFEEWPFWPPGTKGSFARGPRV
jgi:ketosteroid isomerase-like protein